MDVFLSWSGDRSKAMAEMLKEWLPRVIHALKPWTSPDIGKGDRWGAELSSRLETVRVGILCLNADNLTAPWLLFEAGAISKKKDSRACTFLLDVKPGDVDQPLGQFQATTFEESDVLKLMKSLNSDLALAGGEPLSNEVLTDTFNMFWPRLQSTLGDIAKQRAPAKTPVRSTDDKLDEILEFLRGMQRKDLKEAILSREMFQSPPVTAAEMRFLLADALRHNQPQPWNFLGEKPRAAAAGLGPFPPMSTTFNPTGEEGKDKDK